MTLKEQDNGTLAWAFRSAVVAPEYHFYVHGFGEGGWRGCHFCRRMCEERGDATAVIMHDLGTPMKPLDSCHDTSRCCVLTNLKKVRKALLTIISPKHRLTVVRRPSARPFQQCIVCSRRPPDCPKIGRGDTFRLSRPPKTSQNLSMVAYEYTYPRITPI